MDFAINSSECDEIIVNMWESSIPGDHRSEYPLSKTRSDELICIGPVYRTQQGYSIRGTNNVFRKRVSGIEQSIV